jgi:formate hydrogenlyase transcriptional activator
LTRIGDLPLALQPKLLRVLEDQEFERIGGTQTIRTDIRVVAATNRPLEELMEAGEYRSDLFYRLNVFPIDLFTPSGRTEDIPLLVRHFVVEHARRLGRRWLAGELDAEVALPVEVVCNMLGVDAGLLAAVVRTHPTM